MLDTPLATLTAAETRIRQLARAMFNLNAEGTCTDALLYAEGFSGHELKTYGDAARKIANGFFVRRDDLVAVAKTPLKSDDELLAIAADRCAGIVSEVEILGLLRKAGFNHDTLDRLWDRLMPKLASSVGRHIATLPRPTAAA